MQDRLRTRTEVAGQTPSTTRPARTVNAVVGCLWPLVAMSVQEAAAHGSVRCYALIADPGELVDRVARERPELCLVVAPYLDDLPDLVVRLLRANQATRTVVLAADEHRPAEVLATLKAGAHGWLPLATEGARLADALRAVANGETAVPRRLLATVLAELRGDAVRAVALPDGTTCALPPREHDVLLGLSQGLSTCDVAARLGIGEATARGYLASALRRLDVPDRAAAVALMRHRT